MSRFAFARLSLDAIASTPSEFAKQIVGDKAFIQDSLKAAGLLET
jgi:hypothetical protein